MVGMPERCLSVFSLHNREKIGPAEVSQERDGFNDGPPGQISGKKGRLTIAGEKITPAQISQITTSGGRHLPDEQTPDRRPPAAASVSNACSSGSQRCGPKPRSPGIGVTAVAGERGGAYGLGSEEELMDGVYARIAALSER
jgi:hypothetical protein